MNGEQSRGCLAPVAVTAAPAVPTFFLGTCAGAAPSTWSRTNTACEPRQTKIATSNTKTQAHPCLPGTGGRAARESPLGPGNVPSGAPRTLPSVRVGPLHVEVWTDLPWTRRCLDSSDVARIKQVCPAGRVYSCTRRTGVVLVDRPALRPREWTSRHCHATAWEISSVCLPPRPSLLRRRSRGRHVERWPIRNLSSKQACP